MENKKQYQPEQQSAKQNTQTPSESVLQDCENSTINHKADVLSDTQNSECVEETTPLKKENIGYDDDEMFLQPSADYVKKQKLKKAGRLTTKAVAYTAVMTALVYVGTIIGYSSEAFYFNLGDAVILICACLFNPVSAMLAGGLGAFFGDLTVYPATMVFTLVIKALEGLVAGILFHLINKWYDKKAGGIAVDDKSALKKCYILKIVFSCLASLLGITIMMMGYFMCQSLFYGTIAGAIVALPFDCAQGVISLVIANLSLYVLKLDNFRTKLRIN